MSDLKNSRWKAGQSGNPKGRPLGTSEISKLRLSIVDRLPLIVDQLIKKAIDGDIQAARLLLERTIPSLKASENTITFEIQSDMSLTTQAQNIFSAVGNGLIPPAQGAILVSSLAQMVKLKEIEEIEVRIAALEEKANDKSIR